MREDLRCQILKKAEEPYTKGKSLAVDMSPVPMLGHTDIAYRTTGRRTRSYGDVERPFPISGDVAA